VAYLVAFVPVSLTLDPQTVEHEAATAEFAEVAGWLQDHLGQQLAAYVVGLRDPKVVGNSRLDDEAPAWLLRHAEDPGDVRFLVPAARAFAGGAA
jgi:hypothetical protein